jgi:hypothetical protein
MYFHRSFEISLFPKKGIKIPQRSSSRLWLRPAVPTIRKLLKNGAQNPRGTPLQHALRLYSVI